MESYIREVLGMPPRELEPAGVRGGAAAGGAAAAAPSASDGPASGRQPSGVRAVQVRRGLQGLREVTCTVVAAPAGRAALR